MRAFERHRGDCECRCVGPDSALLVALQKFFAQRVDLAASGDLESGQGGANTFDDRVRARTWSRCDCADGPSEVAHHDRYFKLELALLDHRGGIEQVAILRAL